MSLSMYQASVPVLTRALSNLSALLDKAAAHCAAKKIDPAVLLGSRLYPDMFALTRQVQIATDMSKGAGARLSGVEIPKYEDDEKSIDDLKARIAKTIVFLNGLDAKAIDGTEAKDINLTIGGQPWTTNGQTYLLNFAVPNVLFHCATAYGIMRHCGVELGKGDFLGPR